MTNKELWDSVHMGATRMKELHFSEPQGADLYQLTRECDMYWNPFLNQAQWHMLMIPVAWEIEIGRLQFKASSGEKHYWDPLSKNKLDVVFRICNPSYRGGIGRRTVVQGWPRKKVWEPIWKITKAKRAEGMVQVIEHLLNKHNHHPPPPGSNNNNKKLF
jgi:hypothetical protein